MKSEYYGTRTQCCILRLYHRGQEKFLQFLMKSSETFFKADRPNSFPLGTTWQPEDTKCGSLSHHEPGIYGYHSILCRLEQMRGDSDPKGP